MTNKNKTNKIIKILTLLEFGGFSFSPFDL